MSTVWIHSPSVLFAKVLGELLCSLGYSVQFEEEPAAEVALWDLSCCECPYPPSPIVPTLALLRGNENELELDELSALGYRGYLAGSDELEALKRALESLNLRKEEK